MTVLCSRDVECGRCGVTSEQLGCFSLYSDGAVNLDGRAESYLGLLMQGCPVCGYCGPDLSEPPEDPDILGSRRYRAALRRRNYPKSARFFLAFTEVAKKRSPRDAVRAYQKLAWACDDAASEALYSADEASVRRSLRLERKSPTWWRQRSESCEQHAADAWREVITWLRRCEPLGDDEEGVSLRLLWVDAARRSAQFDLARKALRRLMRLRHLCEFTREMLDYQQQLIAQRDVRPRGIRPAREAGFDRF